MRALQVPTQVGERVVLAAGMGLKEGEGLGKRELMGVELARHVVCDAIGPAHEASKQLDVLVAQVQKPLTQVEVGFRDAVQVAQWRHSSPSRL
ncbi:hypothetical protein D3C72_1875260 [compost metagenome]